MDFAIESAIEYKCDTIEFLGDLFHTHAIMRIEVVDFWQKVFEKIEIENIDCRVLVGNHDQPGSKEKEQEMNALNIFEDNIGDSFRTIINKPMIIDNIAYIPYMSDKQDFIHAAKILYEQGATKLLVAHQTFTGAVYENGFYAPDGIDPAEVPQEKIISGHIHKNQEIGKCLYPGTPKWDTMSDANEDKGIWIFEHEEDGSYGNNGFIPTCDVVTPIYKHVMNEGDPEPEFVENAKNYLELVGKSAWITKIKKKYKGKVNIKARPTDRKKSSLGSQEKLSIKKYLEEDFEQIDGVSKEDIHNYLEVLNESA
jgi:DNA repair exonuclease SbcCD nuclease subunit